MQQDIAGCDIVLLGETFSLLTLSHHRGVRPEAYGTIHATSGPTRSNSTPCVQCYRQDMWVAIVGYIGNRFIPLGGCLFS